MVLTIQTNNHEQSIKLFELCSLSNLNDYSFSEDTDYGIEIEINNLDDRLAIARVIDFASKYITKEIENEEA